MSMSSLQVSSMIGGQQVMFANQATYAQQVSSQFYGGAAPTASLQNPYPGIEAGSTGTNVMSGLGSAVPGAIGAASMMGGLVGGPLGMLDPFTTVPSAFRAGTGAVRGAGVTGTISHIGGQFAARGAIGGLGAMAGGLGAAAMMAAPYMAIGAAADYVGGQLVQGAQDIGAVGSIMGRAAPFYGAQGARPGGQAGRRQIQAMTGMLYEMQSQDANLAGQDMVQLLDKAERHGLFSGVTNPQQFQQKFRKMVEQVKNIAQIMGSTIDEAMPMLGSMQQMGLWKAQDVMGTAAASRMVGKAATPALMGTMQAGAQMSWQQGGTLEAGAIAGRQTFMTVQAAMGSGVLNEQSLREMTGGIGGVEGQRALATQMAGTIQSMARTPLGKLMMAGLGETTKEGRFTGRVDPNLMAQFQSGAISLEQLRAMGMKKAGGGRGASSFSLRKEQLGQELAAEGGVGLLGTMSQALVQHSGASSPDAQEIMLRHMGLGEREAGMAMRFSEGMPEMQEFARRRATAAAEAAARELYVKRNRSFEGLKNASKNLLQRSVEEPLKKLAGEISTSIDIMMDSFSKQMFGGMEQVIPGGGVGTMLPSRGALTGPIERMRGSRGIGEAVMGAVSDMMPKSGVLSNLLGGSILGVGGLGRTTIGGTGGQAGRLQSGMGYAEAFLGGGAKSTEITSFARRAEQWARKGGSLEELGFAKDAETSSDFLAVQDEVTKLMTGAGPISRKRMAEIRAETNNEADYLDRLMQEGMTGRGRQAMERLAKKGKGDEPINVRRASVFVQAAKNGGVAEGYENMPALGRIADVTADFRTETTSKGILEMIKSGNESIAKTISDETGLGTVGKAAAAVVGFGAKVIGGGGVLGAALGIGDWLGKPVEGLASDLISALTPGAVSEKEVLQALSNEDWGEDLRRYIETGETSNNKFVLAATKGGNETAKRVLQTVNDLKRDGSKFQIMRGQVMQVGGVIKGGKAEAKLERLRNLSTAELDRLGNLKEGTITGETRTRYESILTGYKEKKAGTEEEARQFVEDLRSDQKGIQQLLATGGEVAGKLAGEALISGIAGRGGSVMGAGQFQQILGQAKRGLGFDPRSFLSKEEKAKIAELQKGGFDVQERYEVQEILKGATKRGQEAGADKKVAGLGERMVDAQTKFTEKIDVFASAVNRFSASVPKPADGSEEATGEKATPEKVQSPK